MIVQETRIKSSSGHQAVSRHVLSGPKNETIRLISGSDYLLKDWMKEAKREGIRYGLRHIAFNPSETMTDQQLSDFAEDICRELGADPERTTFVIHQKDGKTHGHLLLPEWQDSHVLNSKFSWVRLEKLARLTEVRLGHALVPGRHDKATHKQEPRDDAGQGWARLFAFSSELDDKPAAEDRVRAYMASLTNDEAWNDPIKCKVLTLEHHMAAKRMGFEQLFEALASVDEFHTSFLDGSFPATRFFTHYVLPLVCAHQRNDKFAIAKLVRDTSPLLSKDNLKGSAKPLDQLRLAQSAIDSLLALWTPEEPSCAVVLDNVAGSGLFQIPESLKAALAAKRTGENMDATDEAADPVGRNLEAILSFLDCPFSVIPPYAAYVAKKAAFDTHQGVKGLEFDRVMVLMDDGDARGFLFGYDKLLGAKAPSATDLKNAEEGRDSAIDRTRRLFYVTCSRARSSLALVAYSADPAAIKEHVVAAGWFHEDEVVLALSENAQ